MPGNAKAVGTLFIAVAATIFVLITTDDGVAIAFGLSVALFAIGLVYLHAGLVAQLILRERKVTLSDRVRGLTAGDQALGIVKDDAHE
jgi:hypothetical protein